MHGLGRRTLLSLGLALLTAAPAVAGGDPNTCDMPGESPDVIVGLIDDVAYWGSVGDTSAFSFST